MDDVLAEIASKWSTMNEVEQSAVANAIAGVRQRENFLVLMSNFNKVLEFQTAEAGSAGLAMERYGIYLEGVEAAANKMAAAWEGVWQKTISSETIKLLYNVSEGLAKIINKMGGLLPLAIALGVAIVFIKRQAIGAFFVSLYASLGPIGIAIGAIVTVLYLLTGSIKTAAEKLEKLNQEISTYQSNIANLRSGRDQLRSLAEEYDTLRTKVSRTADEDERFLEIQQQIFGILPGVAQGFNDTGDAILNTNVPMQAYLALQDKLIANEMTLLGISTAESFDLRVKTYEDEADKLETLNRMYEGYVDALEKASDENTDIISRSQAMEAVAVYEKAYGSIEELGLEIQKQNVITEQGLIDLAQSYNGLTPALKQYLIDTGAVSESILENMNAITAAVIAQANVVLAAVSAINQALGKTNLFPGKVGGTMGTSFAEAMGAASASIGGVGGKSMLDEIIDKIKEQKQAEKDALKDSLENYRRIINTRKDLLKSLKDEMDYRDLLSDKEKDISKLQNELTSLSLDNSEEVQARRLQLQEELGDKQEDLERTQRDRQYELEVEMLDKEFEAFEYLIDAQIAAIDAYLKNTTQMMVDAMLQLAAIGYGGTASTTGSNPPATTTVRGEPVRRSTNVINRPVSQHTITTAELTGRHSGIESGFVGGLKSNEEFAKLMDGELVITPKQMEKFMKVTLPTIPAMVNAAGGQGMKFDNLLNINVAGNLDKNTVPDLERITDKVMANLNKTLAAKGYMRSVNQFVS